MTSETDGKPTYATMKMDKRKLLAAGAATAVWAGISALLPEKAQAAGFEPVELGEVNTKSSMTTIYNPGEGQTALLCKSGAVIDDGHIGLEGRVLRDAYAPNQSGFYPTGVLGQVASPSDGKHRRKA